MAERMRMRGGLGVDRVERVGGEQYVAGVLYVSQDRMGR